MLAGFAYQLVGFSLGKLVAAVKNPYAAFLSEGCCGMEGAQRYPATFAFEFQGVASRRSSSLRVLGMTTRPALSSVTVTRMDAIIKRFHPICKSHFSMVILRSKESHVSGSTSTTIPRL